MNFVSRKLTCIIIIGLLISAYILPAFEIESTSEILLTSEAGDKISTQENVEFVKGKSANNVIEIFPEQKKQTIDGIGSSLTESSAFVLAHLPQPKRKSVMQNIFGKDGANFSLARTHIASCDFTVEGKYAYVENPDKELKSFSIAQDLVGFDKDKYPHIKNEKYDLLPMIKEALQIKNSQADSQLRIVASAWTAPPWMKDIETWYIPGLESNNW